MKFSPVSNFGDQSLLPFEYTYPKSKYCKIITISVNCDLNQAYLVMKSDLSK